MNSKMARKCAKRGGRERDVEMEGGVVFHEGELSKVKAGGHRVFIVRDSCEVVCGVRVDAEIELP